MQQSFVDAIYKDIGELRLELEPDPTVLGPRYITEITSRCRNYLNKVSLIRIGMSQKRRNLMMQIAGEETTLSMEKDRLLADDPRVQGQPNIRDREAVVNTILRESIARIAALKMDLLDVETVNKAVKLVHDELIRTSAEIKIQRSLLFSDRVSGSGYGDESNTPSKAPPPSRSDLDENELDQIMRGTVPLLGRQNTPSPPKETPVPEPEIDSDLLEVLALVADSDPPSTDTVEKTAPKSQVFDLHAEVPVSELKLPENTLKRVAQAQSSKVNEDDPDLMAFLDGNTVSDKAASKKPKDVKAVAPITLNDGEIDFSDLLSNL